MTSKKQKLCLISSCALLVTVAFTVSCTGFFVKPTLSSIAVSPPTPTIETGDTGNTVQMSATATYNDGSTGNPSVTWSITPTSVATISSSGLVTSVSTGTATITATSTQNAAISGTQSLTVTVGCIQTITLNPTNASLTNGGTTSVPITATAHTCNSPVDITDVATWLSSNTSIATVSAGVVTPTGTTGADGTVTITASSGNIISNPATVTVSGY